jgi:quinol monooxygenase YgiN
LCSNVGGPGFGAYFEGNEKGESMPASSLRVVARIKAKAESVGEVRDLLCGLVGPTRKESGCVSYELLQNREDPTDFTFVEEWESDAALESHAASDHIRAIGPKLQPVVAEAPDIRTYLAVN